MNDIDMLDRPAAADARAATRPSKAAPPTARRSRVYRPPVPAGAVEAVFLGLLPAAMLLLMALSVVGTYYGARGIAAPLWQPWLIVRDMVSSWSVTLLAVVAQLALTVAQWGGRQVARRDARWWALYALALALSVYWNWEAFGAPLVGAGVPWLVALLIIAAGDILPEWLLVDE